MNKKIVVRKDGIVYERRINEPKKTKCLCIRIEEDTFNKLKEDGIPSKIIKSLIRDYFEEKGE